MLYSGALESKINDLYEKSGFINGNMSWAFKLLEMLQDQSAEAYDIYKSLNEEQKEEVLKELYEMDNDMGSYGDSTLETSKENLSILLKDAKNGKKYADGGSVEDTGNANVLKYFSGLDMSALPDNAAQYIKDQILNDQNINLLPTDDEDFVDVKNTIAKLYPSAVGVKKQETANETKTEGSEVSEWKEAIETLNMLIEDGGSKKDLDEWNEAFETLNMLIEG